MNPADDSQVFTMADMGVCERRYLDRHGRHGAVRAAPAVPAAADGVFSTRPGAPRRDCGVAGLRGGDPFSPAAVSAGHARAGVFGEDVARRRYVRRGVSGELHMAEAEWAARVAQGCLDRKRIPTGRARDLTQGGRPVEAKTSGSAGGRYPGPPGARPQPACSTRSGRNCATAGHSRWTGSRAPSPGEAGPVRRADRHDTEDAGCSRDGRREPVAGRHCWQAAEPSGSGEGGGLCGGLPVFVGPCGVARRHHGACRCRCRRQVTRSGAGQLEAGAL